MKQTPSTAVTAVVLAGGQGTRIRHLLGDLPKPMASVAGRPFLDWVLMFLRRQSIQRVILSTGYRSEVIEQHYTQNNFGMDLQVAREETPLGTAGGLLNASQSAPPDWRNQTKAWLVVNGDSLAVCELARLFALLDEPEVAGGILAVRVEDASRFGTLEVADDGRVKRFAEKQPGSGLVNAGVYLLRDDLLKLFPANRPLSFETEVFPEILAKARLRALAVDAPLLDIGVPESLAAAEAFIQRHVEWFGPRLTGQASTNDLA